jgi:large subunit ribosomal protein L34
VDNDNLPKVVFLLYYLHMSFTYKPSKKKRATTHGFLARTKSANGKKVLARRRVKGRRSLSVSK